MKKLDSEFALSKYGLRVRLVTEEDASFIVKLRSDATLSKYIHKTEDNIEKQINWIKEYKEREFLGKEYYFVFSSLDNVKLGLERIYNIKDDNCSHGSLVFDKEAPLGAAILADIITREILFDFLDLRLNYFEVSKGNTGVINYHLKYSPILLKEDEESYYYSLSRENFEVNKNKFLKIFKTI